MFKPLLSLTLISSLCGLILVGTDAVTNGRIDANRSAQTRALYAELLGEAVDVNLSPGPAPAGDCGSWLFMHGATPGYAADITYLALWRASGGVHTEAAAGLPEADAGTGADAGTVSLRVTAHRETPGIGDFIDHRRSNWLPRLDRSSLPRVMALDRVTGATITSEAVRTAMQNVFRRAELHCGGA